MAVRKKRSVIRFLVIRLVLLFIVGIPVYMGIQWALEEARTSNLQAREFARLAGDLSYWMEDGPSHHACFPEAGPYDLRLGYARLPEWLETLGRRGYSVQAQARVSGRFQELVEQGLFPIYREKTQAGLRILDHDGNPLWDARYPERVYARFEDIPRFIVDSLLFIENRELLDETYPCRNPAVEWDRLGKVILDGAVGLLNERRKPAGGSTIATQLEKFRHSPEGRTGSVLEKLRQMASASFRAYQDGEDTSEARRRLVLDYLNSIPLAALPGYGEVNGLGDGLWAWCAADFAAVNGLLREGDGSRQTQDMRAKGLAFRQVLSLLLAHRRPSYYLVADKGALHGLVESYLRLLAAAHIIPQDLAQAASSIRPEIRQRAPLDPSGSFVERKAANVVRTSLLSLLSLQGLYDLDRLDLTAMSAFDRRAQDALTHSLIRLHDPSVAEAAGLRAPRLLGRGDLSRVSYSLTLYERTPHANLLRVQTDNFEGPFNINEGVKLDLGSTAKLRTLVNYLEIVASLHQRYAEWPGFQLLKALDDLSDPLSRWAIEHFIGSQDRGLATMLEAALDRQYSASPDESFFTGGGLHTFQNFSRDDDQKLLSVREGFRNSVNLVFVRLMRDMVRHYMYRATGITAPAARYLKDPQWKAYLSGFADKEGREFMGRFYQKYRGKTPDEAMDLLAHGVPPTPKRLASVFRFARPSANLEAFTSFLRARLPQLSLSEKALRELFDAYAPGRYSLADQGFLAHVHPLELWIVSYVQEHPRATRAELMAAGAQARQAAYQWLLRGGRKKSQERRIGMMMEVEAFQEIHRAWKRVGYPFDSLVPSYATAIGSSADSPAGLAELVGILINNGVRLPTLRVEWLHFAQETPYETVMRRGTGEGERVLPKEVAEAARRALVDVVENGTARRGRGAFRRPDGSPIQLGGKTGTGDHRFETYGPAGQLISRRVVNRTATFVFFIGDRLFGAVTAFVPGAEAASYEFTSALPVQLLKSLAPLLTPLLQEPPPEPRPAPHADGAPPRQQGS